MGASASLLSQFQSRWEHMGAHSEESREFLDLSLKCGQQEVKAVYGGTLLRGEGHNSRTEDYVTHTKSKL